MLKTESHYEMTDLPLGHKTVTCKECRDKRHAYTEKGIHVALSTKLMLVAHSRVFEAVILLSGDKDYLQTVQAVKNMGLRAEIVSWRASLSKESGNESSSGIIYLDDLKNERAPGRSGGQPDEVKARCAAQKSAARTFQFACPPLPRQTPTSSC